MAIRKAPYEIQTQRRCPGSDGLTGGMEHALFRGRQDPRGPPDAVHGDDIHDGDDGGSDLFSRLDPRFRIFGRRVPSRAGSTQGLLSLAWGGCDACGRSEGPRRLPEILAHSSCLLQE